MAGTLDFHFEDLPLVMEAGFEAAEVSGAAEIAYHGDGEWCVRAIALDATRRLSPSDALTTGARFARTRLALDDGDPLFLRILDRLEHGWASRVGDAVADALAQARAAAPDTRADRRRALYHA